MDHRAGTAPLHRLRQFHRNLRRRARLERCQGDDLFQRREPCPGASAGFGDRDLFQPRLQGKRARSGHLHHPLRRDAGGRGPDLADHAEPRDRRPELFSHERRPPPEPLGRERAYGDPLADHGRRLEVDADDHADRPGRPQIAAQRPLRGRGDRRSKPPEDLLVHHAAPDPAGPGRGPDA